MTVTEAPGSKERLIEAAVSLISTRGYENTGIQEILDTAGVSKSNFYYHFKSKETLCLAAFDVLAERFSEQKIRPTLGNSGLPPLERFTVFFEALDQMMTQMECNGGCPIVNLAAETSDYHPAFREKIGIFFTGFQKVIEEAYSAGVASGDFRDDVSPQQVAGLILSGMNGAMLQAKARKSTGIIRDSRDALIRLIARQA